MARHGGVTRGATRWRDTWQVVEPLLRCLTALAGPHTLVLLSASLLHSPETIELFRSEARNEFSTAEDLIRAEMQPAATRYAPYTDGRLLRFIILMPPQARAAGFVCDCLGSDAQHEQFRSSDVVTLRLTRGNATGHRPGQVSASATRAPAERLARGPQPRTRSASGGGGARRAHGIRLAELHILGHLRPTNKSGGRKAGR